MDRNVLRAGIAGSGFAADFHVDALRRVYGVRVEIAGVYSPTKEHREAFARRKEIAVFDSLDRLIDSCDVVHDCTPPASHENLAVTALGAGRSVIVEKPFTGYFGTGKPDFDGLTFPREDGVRSAMKSVDTIREAERRSSGRILYAENWVYAPAIQKEREILEKGGGRVLWMLGQESHSGSHSKFYGIWSFSGGGSLMGKGVHPLTGMLYLKKVEGRARNGKPIRPSRVSVRTHRITASPAFRDLGHLRSDYRDIEDFAAVHLEFEDGTAADVFATELVMGGVRRWVEVSADNHRSIINIAPTDAMSTYNPSEEYFEGIEVVEKIGTKQGWAPTTPDGAWFTGYQHEMEAFYRNIAHGSEIESDSLLAADTIAVVYAGYLSAERDGAAVDVPLVEE